MSETRPGTTAFPVRAGSAGEVFAVFLKLGLTSFGGPVAHLGYFREELVRRRGWLAEEAYAGLVALCQFLPGPASSQVGMAIGLMRAGPLGMAAAWLGFTLPSALVMIAFAYGVAGADAAGHGTAGWLAGLKLAAVAIVADAVLGMARNLCPDRERRTLALLAAAGAALVPGAAGQIGVILAGGLLGLLWLKPSGDTPGQVAGLPPGRLPAPVPALAAFALFVLLLVLLPLAARAGAGAGLALFDTLYRAGALVFGGGHVVLPLIESALVHPGGLTREAFLAGYGAVQAVPGPLFSFAAYVGAMMPGPPNGVAGAAIGLAAIFLPSALLVYAALPFWSRLAGQPRIRQAMAGINAAVVGLLGAAFWDPVVTSSLTSARAFALALLAYLALALWRAPAWAVVAGAALAGAALLRSS
ncbi:chromate efflux transporter [Ancylobacter mangrovi]|uniref:chromate efflux transporter n=1 Tax=Ancylobacter mangrovi TaxID=2972472 RepID=UPI002163277F|nr:chromate efflux transporter [Ancylobacter mangrovi]MCS0504356.1 chromate efflux transporter [Ancylobacter mangrovi]